jgi:hypothetical protein
MVVLKLHSIAVPKSAAALPRLGSGCWCVLLLHSGGAWVMGWCCLAVKAACKQTHEHVAWWVEPHAKHGHSILGKGCVPECGISWG